MLRKPPVVVWRYVTAELWRLMLLTCAVLVTVIAFSAAVKPLADGKLGPVDALRFMMLAIPPMLQFALPFAAGFAATLAYHRLAADNELSACHAGGISHRSMLMPSLVTGLVLGAVLLGLTNRIIPAFLRQMQHLVTEDVTRVLVNSMNRGEAVRLGNRLIYADMVQALGPDKDGLAYQRLYLHNMLFVEFNSKGDVSMEAVADEAVAWLFRATEGDAAAAGDEPGGGGGGEEGLVVGARSRQAHTQIVIKLTNYVVKNPGELAVSGADHTLPAFRIPNAFTDDPKFLSWSELARARREPEMLNFIDDRRRRLATHLAQQACIDFVRAQLRQTGGVTLVDPLGRPVRLLASDIRYDAAERAQRVVPAAPGGPIAVRLEPADSPVRTYEAQSAMLNFVVDPEAPRTGVTLRLTLGVVSAGDEGGAAVDAPRSRRQIEGLIVRDSPVPDLLDRPSAALLRMAADRLGGRDIDDPFIAQPVRDLRERIDELNREITSKVHERFAMAAAAVVMVMTGAVMAMRLRTSLPLTVYLWSFFPALATVLMVSAGQQLVHDHGTIALPVLWGGVALFGGFAVFEFVKLARH